MISQKKLEIKGNTYLIQQMNGWDGIKIGRKLVKILGPAMVAVFQEEDGLTKGMDIVAEHLDDFDDELIKKLLSTVTKNGYAIKVEEEFAGNYWTLIKLMQEVIWFNFQDVFTEGLGITQEELPTETVE